MEWWMWLLIALGAFALLCVAALAYWNNAVRTVRYTYENKKLPRSFDGFKIAHVSDFHNKYYGKGAKRLVRRIANESPDIIVISGDMIQSRRMQNALALVDALVSVAPVYYVSGNHERYVEEYPEFKEKMSAMGVHILEDESVALTHGDGEIALCGAVDPRFYMRRSEESSERFYEHIKDLRVEGKFNLLLSHRPEFMSAYVKAGFDLVLSGHAHAGQVRFPFVGAVFTPGEKFRPRYIVGRYDECSTTMIVSGGLGSSSIIPRVLNRPQLLIETLKCG